MSPERRSRPAGDETASKTPTTKSDPSVSDFDRLDAAIAAASTDWWFSGAVVALHQLAMTNRGFTADDLLAMVGEPPHPQYVGVAFAALHRSKIIEAVGARIGQDGRALKVWWAATT